MKTKIAAALALFAVIGTTATSAHADPPREKTAIEYKFEDDGLIGKDMAGNTPIIRRATRARSRLLHRPRLQFVQEMLKSVENM